MGRSLSWVAQSIAARARPKQGLTMGLESGKVSTTALQKSFSITKARERQLAGFCLSGPWILLIGWTRS